MHRYYQTVVVGDLKCRKRVLAGVGSVGAYHKEAVLIVAAGGSYCVYEHLVEVVHDLSAFVVAAVPLELGVLPARLVHALENEVLVIALELLRYLRPAGGELRGDLLLLVGIGLVPFLVVHIEDNVHIKIIGIIHYLLDPRHPLGVYHVVFVHLLFPCGGNAHRVEACVLYPLDKLPGGLGIAPAGFLGNAAASGGVQGIAEVPAYPDIRGKLQCGQRGVELVCGHFRCGGFSRCGFGSSAFR